MEQRNRAYFIYRPRRLSDLRVPHRLEAERSYTLVEEIALPAIDYENFCEDLLADRVFLEEKAHLCRGEGFPCLLVRERDKEGGVLVRPEGAFVSWAAALP